MVRHLLKILPAIMLLLIISGCSFESGEDLYALPQPPQNYVNLQTEIDKVLNGGARYAAPSSGENMQPVQLEDLDSDGVPEAIAFFRINSTSALKIYIYKMIGDEYDTFGIIEGSGDSVASVEYADLNADGYFEIIVSWTMGDLVPKAMSVYSIAGGSPTSLLVTSYSKYTVCDLDGDGNGEIIAIPAKDASKVWEVELYDFKENGTLAKLQVPLSTGMGELSKIKTGYIEDKTPAVFITGAYGSSGIITDIIAMKNGELINVTMNPETGSSYEVLQYYAIYPTDINNDGIIELALPEQLPVYKTTDPENYWTITWRSYSTTGKAKEVLSTYYDYTDGWYLILPDDWDGRITVSRQDTVSGERANIFMIWNGTDTAPDAYMTIYTLTGYKREDRSKLEGRFIIDQTTDTIYAAEFSADSSDWKYAISQEELIKNFNIIKIDWTTD